MGLFEKVVGLAVNVVTTPIAVVQDVISLGGAIDNNGHSHTLEHLKKITDDANED